MPRRNHTKPHQPYDSRPLSQTADKTSYPTKHAAEQAAKEAMKYLLDIELSVYQSPTDGKWYLTSTRGDK